MLAPEHLRRSEGGAKFVVLSEENSQEWPANRQVETLDAIVKLYGLLPD